MLSEYLLLDINNYIDIFYKEPKLEVEAFICDYFDYKDIQLSLPNKHNLCDDAIEKRSIQQEAQPVARYTNVRYDFVWSSDDSKAYKELERHLREMDVSFSEYLLRLIDAKKMTDADCYNKAQLNRAHFNKIKNEQNYHVQKKTVIALALALELEKSDADALLKKAGYAFSSSSKSDLIIEYCIEHKIYDVKKVNDILFAFDQELLGAGVRE